MSAVLCGALHVTACGSSNESAGREDGGTPNSGGASNGGDSTNGGTPNSGGASASGGSSSGGTTNGSGGKSSSAGASSDGGSPSSGGASSAGGRSGTSGAKSTGGSSGGGNPGAGGTPTTGGASGSGGAGNMPTCPGDRPSETNTGVPKGVTLVVVNSDVTVTQDGATVDAQDIHGFLVIKASHVHVTRSIVRGGVATQNGDGIRVQSGTDILIEDTEVALAHPSAYLDGIAGSNMVVRRANIHGGVDGMKLGSNSTVECSYIHDLASFASDPNQNGGPTHNDAIQILSGTGIHVVGNELLAAKDQNSAIQVTQDFGAVGELHIESNWADGGGCTFNFSHKGGATLTGVTAINNRFGRNSFYGCPILKSTQTTLTSSGNVYDDDGTAVPIQTHD